MFFFSKLSRRSVKPTHPRIQWEPGTVSSGMKRPELQTDHSLLWRAEVMNEWSYISTSPICLVGLHVRNFNVHRKLLGPIVYASIGLHLTVIDTWLSFCSALQVNDARFPT
jgi:hypothetical protein